MKTLVSLLLLVPSLIFTACTEYSQEFQIAYTNGQIQYKKFCAQCHGKNGEGYKELYPPISPEVFKKHSLEEIICISKYGLNDTFTVGKITYKVPMPPVPEITNQDLAYLITFLASEYGNLDSVFTKKDMEKVLNNCNLKK